VISVYRLILQNFNPLEEKGDVNQNSEEDGDQVDQKTVNLCFYGGGAIDIVKCRIQE
jgi:hypothetical protein